MLRTLDTDTIDTNLVSIYFYVVLSNSGQMSVTDLRHVY